MQPSIAKLQLPITPTSTPTPTPLPTTPEKTPINRKQPLHLPRLAPSSKKPSIPLRINGKNIVLCPKPLRPPIPRTSQ